jgi:orotate phosphoribosyltransferase
MTSKNHLIKILKENRVFKTGNFTLSSGKKSNYYIDIKKAITKPKILKTITKLINQSIIDDDIDKIAGPTLGAVPIATALSLQTNIPMLMIRKEKKTHGTGKLIEGELKKEDKVIVVEDVTTTGESLIKSIKNIQKNGGLVKKAIVVIDREEGAGAELQKENIRFEPLITINELF